MSAAAWALGYAVLLAGLGLLNWPVMSISPDGRRYLDAGKGRPVALPFMLRWLVPRVCGASIRRWRWFTTLHLIALPPLVTIWMQPWVSEGGQRVFGGLLVCGLAGVWRIHLRWPVLVDGAAMAWSVGSAILFQQGHWIVGILVALVAACIKETAPVFAACYAWNPLALAGLLAPLVRRLFGTVGEDSFGQPELLRNPWRASRLYHAGRWFDPFAMALPWGAGLLALLVTDHRIIPMLVVTVTLAYAQLLIATDTARLYQWAAPPVLLGAAEVIPAHLAVVVLLAHLFNPWAGSAEV